MKNQNVETLLLNRLRTYVLTYLLRDVGMTILSALRRNQSTTESSSLTYQ